MTIDPKGSGGRIVDAIRTDDEYEAAVERITELMDIKGREAREERLALRALIGRYEERELVWARAW